MKIVHVYARNLEVFEQALEGTGCRINGSRSLDYLMGSLSSFNARDVLGLVVFAPRMTKKTLKLINAFDEQFVFCPLPIIVLSDNATQLYNSGILKVKHCPLFLVDSVEGTISDVDVNKVFATLCCETSELYDLSFIEHKSTSAVKDMTEEVRKATYLADEIEEEYRKLGGE